MKTRIIILSIFYFLPLPLKVIAQENDNYLMLFVDKSISVKQQNSLDNYIYHLVKKHCLSDKLTVEVRFLFENTATISSKVFEFKKPKFPKGNFRKENLPLQEQLYNGKVKRAKKKFAKKVVEYVNSFQAKARQTEIVSALVPISRNRAKNLHVVFISDMLESSHRFRKMDSYPFKTEKESIWGARQDVKKLHRIFLVPQKLQQNIHVLCVLPVSVNTKEKAFQFVEAYWRTVFSSFGIVNKDMKFESI